MSDTVWDNTVSSSELPAFLQKWQTAIATGDPNEVVSCYAETGCLKGTIADSWAQGHSAICSYFEKLFTKGSIEVAFNEIHKIGEGGLYGGSYQFHVESLDEPLQAHYTFQSTEDGEAITLHHSSST